ncbi:hypothetical protein [Algibacter mikhailovii]|uniref:Uncharacterized protein n=1 Tax=Algibacter mikhailovii TaxID=425498 RepID=A0A918QZN2_9FLAO|nr:hypothetical protein [Algibacter mikhailovii]GGZ77485.1 hypothetical protein GCM10007028_13440 [Algibacter mikhailovii]
MKTKATLLIILLLNVLSCDEIDKLTEFDVRDNFESVFRISESANSEGQPVSITETVTVDISTNQEIADNLNLIQSIAIESITFKIENFSGNDNITLSNASIAFNNEIITLEDINLSSAEGSGTVYNIGTASNYNTIANILKNDPSVTAKISGTISEIPVSFDLRLKVDLKVVIDVI